MRYETLEQKTLRDGSTISLVKRPLVEVLREALGLPSHATEMSICLATANGQELATSPRASWYLGEDVFREIYEAIESHNHYRNASNALGRINDEADARKLVGMSDMPAARIIHAPFAKEFIPDYK